MELPSTEGGPSSSELATLLCSLITANHILHYRDVVDAYGHISVRNFRNPETFFVSTKDLAPALVSDATDIEEYRVSDASPVNSDAPMGYIERYIHSEIYKRYKDVQCVIHSHSEAIIPFSISSVPLRPVFHMGAVIGARVPVYDIALHYKSSDPLQSLLVNNEHLGAALAAGFSPASFSTKASTLVRKVVSASPPEPEAFPPHPLVLMRGHGFTCVGKNIEETVFRAVYACTNARIQTTSLLMQGSFNTAALGGSFMSRQKDKPPPAIEDLKYMSDRECKDSFSVKTTQRPWKLWCAEVANSGLYRNALGEPPGA